MKSMRSRARFLRLQSMKTDQLRSASVLIRASADPRFSDQLAEQIARFAKSVVRRIKVCQDLNTIRPLG